MKALALAAVLIAAAWAQAPSVAYSVNPSPANAANIMATCPPTVVGIDSAFLCYRLAGVGDVVQYVNPSQPQFIAPQGTVNITNQFLFPPIPLSRLTAVSYSASPTSSYYLMFSAVSANVKQINRYGSTAEVAYGSDINMTFVPIGVTRAGQYDSIVAFSVTASTEQESLVWSHDFTLPNNFPYTTQLSTPIYYRGLLMVMAGQTFVVFNASTGGIKRQKFNPCNWTFDSTMIVQMHVVTFGSDANGNLDAFILIANRTTPEGIVQASVCRVSHNTGLMEWRTDYDNANVRVLDVTGSNSTILITGWVSTYDSQELITWSMSAMTGSHQYSIPRSTEDQYSFPAVLAQPVSGCIETVVLQVDGKLNAYCTGSYDTPVWTSNFACNHRAAIHPSTNSIACVTRGASVQLLDSDGNLVWLNDQISAIFAAQIVGDLVWVVDLDATLWGLTITASATPLPPPYIAVPAPPSDGLSAGAVTGIVFTVFIVGGVIGAAAVAYMRFSKRRSAQYDSVQSEHEKPVGSYGGIA